MIEIGRSCLRQRTVGQFRTEFGQFEQHPDLLFRILSFQVNAEGSIGTTGRNGLSHVPNIERQVRQVLHIGPSDNAPAQIGSLTSDTAAQDAEEDQHQG